MEGSLPTKSQLDSSSRFGTIPDMDRHRVISSSVARLKISSQAEIVEAAFLSWIYRDIDVWHYLLHSFATY